MTRLRNVNPLGAVDLPLIGREGDNGVYVERPADASHDVDYVVREPVEGSGCLEADEVFEVSDEDAAVLLEQATNYVLADEAKPRRHAAAATTDAPEA